MSAPTGHTDVAPPGGEPPGASASPDTRGAGDGDRPQVYLDLPDVSSSNFRHRRSSRWWRYGFPIALVLLFAAVPILVYVGAQVVLKSNDGRLIPSTADPNQPGWQATVPPTPTMVLATVNDKGGLSSVALLALTSDKVGSVVLIPADTQTSVDGTPMTLVAAYRLGGQQRLKRAVESITGAGIDEIMLANSGNWEELVTPAGALTFDNPDNVIVDGSMLFPEGRLTVPPSKVGAFVESRNWAEDDTNRLLRQEYLWKAWFAKIGADPGSTAVPGEVDSGIGRYLKALSHETVDFEVLPVQVHALTTAYAGVYLPLPGQVRALIGQVIPFPTSATPGDRPRIRVFDGTGRLGHGLAAAHNLALAGAQIDSIGNASSFHVAHTQLIVASEQERAAAEKLREVLGVGTVVVDGGADDTIDITVVLGADAIGRPQAESTTLAPSTSGSASSSTATTGG